MYCCWIVATFIKAHRTSIFMVAQLNSNWWVCWATMLPPWATMTLILDWWVQAEFVFTPSFRFCSNYDFKNTILDGHTQPYKIFTKEGLKIGVFGIGIKLQGLVLERMYLKPNILTPLKRLPTYRMLRQEKQCDYIICVSHIGYKYENCHVRCSLGKPPQISIWFWAVHSYISMNLFLQNLDGKRCARGTDRSGGIRGKNWCLLWFG